MGFVDKFKEAGGNHWALLVYIRATDKFYYFDSGSGIIRHVTKIATKLRCLIMNNEDIKEVQRESEEIVVMPNAPKQKNSYDCGVYVLAMTQEILRLYAQDQGFLDALEGEADGDTGLRGLYALIEVDFDETVNPESVTELRKEIRRIISKMSKK